MKYAALIVSLATALLWQSTSWATSMGVVVLGDGAGADKAVGFVQHYLLQALAQDNRYTLVEPYRIMSGAGFARAKESFEQAEILVREAHEAYESLDLDTTILRLEEALQYYQQHAAFLTDVRSVANATMLYGATHILRGEQDLGIDRLAQAVSIDSGVEPDPRIFNPSMREVFHRAVDDTKAKKRSVIALTSSPSGARVYVDGEFRGVTPLNADHVLAGPHFVRIEKDGYAPWGKYVTTGGGREISENVSLNPAPQAQSLTARLAGAATELLRGKLSSIPPNLKDVAADVGVEQAFIVVVQLDGEQVALSAAQFNVADESMIKAAGHRFTYARQPEPYHKQVDELLRRHFSERTLHEDTDDDFLVAHRGGAGCGPMSCQALKTTMLIGGTGLGLVATGVGALMWASAQRNYNEYLEVPQVHDLSKELRSKGQTQALVGDVLIPLGAVLAVASIATYFLWQPVGSGTATTDVPVVSVGGGIVPVADGGAHLFFDMRF